LATFDYELILMLDPQAGDEQREKIASDAKSRLESKGEIKHEANWGMRKMAYEIERRGEADYRVWRFTGGKDLLDDLDHSLKIADGVLRFRIFKVEAGSPNIVPPDTEQVMRRDEDDRGRGRGDRGDRGPRRSRPDSPPAERSDSPPAERSDDEDRSAEAAPASAAGSAEAGS
jgi:small subunit ribosomal protein S6